VTEGRAERAIAVDVGIVSTSQYWQNTSDSYDVAVGGQPFFYAINDQRPYIRQTAPLRIQPLLTIQLALFNLMVKHFNKHAQLSTALLMASYYGMSMM